MDGLNIYLLGEFANQCKQAVLLRTALRETFLGADGIELST
jgi:hypothetical protein